MTTLNLQRFTRVETLRAIKQELLAEFLQPYNDFFQSRGVSLAPQEDSGELDNVLPVYWLRGGFPDSFLARNDDSSGRWRDNFIRTFLERDIPQLGFSFQH